MFFRFIGPFFGGIVIYPHKLPFIQPRRNFYLIKPMCFLNMTSFLGGWKNAITLAKPYPYSKAVHIPCQNSSGNLENNERPLMMRIRLCDPCHALPCHVLSCPIAHV